MKRLLGVSLTVLLAACGGPRAEAPQPRPEGQPAEAGQPTAAERAEALRQMDGFRVSPPPIFSLLGQRERLSLTSPQVTQLDSLAVWLADANRELNRELRGLVGDESSSRRRPATADERNRTMAVMQQIGRNNRQAMDGVQEVLTDDQERIVCEMERARADDRGNRPRLPESYGPPRNGVVADTLYSRAGNWSWCRRA